MTIFLILMVVGLTGLFMMAIPGLAGHGHALGGGGHGIGGHALGGHGGLHALNSGGHAAASASGQAIAHGPAHASAPAASHGDANAPASGAQTHFGLAQIIPSPRAIFSSLAVYGAFGYALVQAWSLQVTMAALVALIPAILLERLVITPLWNVLFQFQGQPTRSLDMLLLDEATAVTPFHNGRGIVSAVHDKRIVQLTADMTPRQASLPVRVGDKLCIEEVDAAKARVVVSMK